MGSRWPVWSLEECGKERGNQKEQRGPAVIISLQFSLGCRHPWVASPSVGQGRSFASREAAALGYAVMPVDPGSRKGPSKGFFSFMSRQCLFLILLHHVVLFGTFGLEVCFHPAGRTFLLELGWKG